MSAQDQQTKGVTTYGGAAPARNLYAQPAVQPGRPVRGGGAPANFGGAGRTFTQAINSRGMQRDFIVHVPPTYQPSRPMPIIFVFHGLSMTNNMMPPLTGMNGAGDRYGFIIVYPQGYNMAWNDGLQNGTNADDVQFVVDMLGALSRELNIDQRHVYACGLSNGGYFSQKLACDLPGRISAVASIAANSVEATCSRCRGSAPIMFFLGTKDPLAPRDGEEGQSLGKLGDLVGLGDLKEMGINSLDAVKDFAGLYSQQESVEWWAKHNGASTQPSVVRVPDSNPRDGCTVTRETYGGGAREVVAYIVKGGGHTWPGGLPVMKGVLGRTTGDINASDLICQFFRSH